MEKPNPPTCGVRGVVQVHVAVSNLRLVAPNDLETIASPDGTAAALGMTDWRVGTLS